MKPTPPPLKVATPCPKIWEEMKGNQKQRFCEQCQLHVHNLSAMSARERDAMVERTGGQACISYELRADGTMITTNWRTQMEAAFRRVGYALAAVFATIFPFAFGACQSPQKREAYRTGGVMCPPETKAKGKETSSRLTGDMASVPKKGAGEKKHSN
jgi:hypothetical protein